MKNDRSNKSLPRRERGIRKSSRPLAGYAEFWSHPAINARGKDEKN